MPARGQPVFGVDIGGTKVHAVMTCAEGRVLAQAREPTDRRGGAALIDQLVALRDRLAARTGGPASVAVGVGVPGSVAPDTHALSRVPNIAGLEGRAFFSALTARFGPRLVLENDVNLAALAEAWVQPADPLAFIAIGTGIGMGLVVEGKLLRGAAGMAGEIAALPLGGDPAEASPGSGALEERLGGDGWRAAARAAGVGGTGEIGGGSDDLPALFASDDPQFARVLAQQADLLARAILCVCAVAAPQAVVLGGSIGCQPRLLAASRDLLPRYMRRPPELRGSALGNDAGALGAALAARTAFTR